MESFRKISYFENQACDQSEEIPPCSLETGKGEPLPPVRGSDILAPQGQVSRQVLYVPRRNEEGPHPELGGAAGTPPQGTAQPSRSLMHLMSIEHSSLGCGDTG